VAVVQPGPGDLFLEIGPGRGQMTLPLAAAGARVVAVEVDRDLAAELRRVASPQIEVITGDVLSRDLAEVVDAAAQSHPPERIRVVGNLPYNLSSPILFHLLDAQRRCQRFHDAHLMLQREVADRLVADPGTREYGPLAILTRLAADAERVAALPPGAFRPPPRVRSALVRLGFRASPVEIADLPLFEGLVRSIFTRRRKTVLNALAPYAGDVSSSTPRAVLDRTGVEHQRRPETLTLTELAALAEALRQTRRGPASSRPVLE